ncbi:murein biosynthesis integral membrane protein MurJ [Mycobacterium botniense]|uniref:Murein biosynthesis integral membrane protein MurJ n=1 Tax=Mycobacterium botniense TaxID=84962 RepID=A0A7I9XVG4_9MYCO|nr:murein biosynthesis integral membrane protein MurJ [Mycobacterium botniense]GFG73778.1 murein biosynthesis integral membrane protein MurJ [Mycobacterium botniense]
MTPAGRRVPPLLPPHTPSQATALPRSAHAASQSRFELSDAAVVSRSWGMALATLVSRITGFARIVLLAAILGAALSSAFSVANQLPNLVAALVLEATFTAIFVPVLARAEQNDPDRGAAFVRRLVTLATSVLLAATVLSVCAAPLLVRLMLGHTPQVNEPLTTAFAYLLLPQVIFYGLSSVFMAILNTRNVFGPPAWAPVVNNVVAIATLGLYVLVPGELSVDPVRMGNHKLLVLGIGTTSGVIAQTAVLLVALRRQHVSLRPLWGIDQRLKRFGAMAAAMVLYVLISQLGLVVTNQIASTAAASGPAIYYYTWLVLMLPFGIVGVTVLTVVMPRLSRNAAADDTAAVLADLSLATRLTMITLIPTVAVMTVGGPAIGSALFAYGHFGDVDAGYLGAAISLSAFTLIPYALVLLQLRVFYAREQPWTPIAIIVVITTVKVVASVLAPHLTDDRALVAGYLGFANGLGFLAGAIVGYYLLRRTLRPAGGHLVGVTEVRTILVTLAASLSAALIARVSDWLLGLAVLTTHSGGVGSLLRLFALTAVMLPVMAAVMLRAQLPEAHAALDVVSRWITRGHGRPHAKRRAGFMPFGHHMPGRTRLRAARSKTAPTVRPPVRSGFTYPKHRNPLTPRGYAVPEPIRDPRGKVAGAAVGKGPEVTDHPSDTASPSATSDTELPRSALHRPDESSARFSDNPLPEPRPRETPWEQSAPSSAPQDVVHLVPGARVAGGRYRLLVFHGGAPPLQFWQALDTALDRQVALTFVDPDGALPDEERQEILSRTLRLSRIHTPGIARVLDVVRTGAGGLVVAEWVRGGSLQEVADTAPSPVGAVRAMQSLAAAADAAHRLGVALSLDHPSRVRVSIDGDVVLAYPATMPDANPQDDIRGIGATLYALLVNRWPLPESGVRSGLAPAERDATGQPLDPCVIDPDIPFQISAIAVRSVQQDGGIRSASTLLNLLQQAAVVADRTEVLGPINDPVSLPDPFYHAAPVDEEVRARRRRNLLIGIGAALAIIAVALLVLASVLSRIFGDVGGGLDKARLGLNTPSTTASASASRSAPAGSIVKPVRATVFSPGGDPDNPSQAGLAIDGDPATVWATDTYNDAVPFPGFKSGVGLLLQLPQPTVVGAVAIDISSTGTVVQIRSSATATPVKLDDTTPLTPPVPLHPGHNDIPVKTSAPTSNLLVWISTLGNTGGKSRADVSEVTVRAAS